MQELFELGAKILSEQLNIEVDNITMETAFEDINADSIDVVEMIMAIEDVYDVEFPESDLEDYPTMGSLIEALYTFLKREKNE
ncbi:hypothetical protein SYNTR_0494 [Candidatus Syntrophocurvum alkaliphilum]|uniref:Acyl carrier protein n=1 Tax=Candidatus Syntrophocurvum alkaliphilum TaxID=2293317 RepID=A0A6I6D9D8_9FIRM|nr:acyl carrier protein [Candidatus Syntrophocurvum alkaliphilum]QGT99087.1 hypothetical protein SYNTR_0494 [Candidatus Syntrophocurvum alkaliphilum]